MVLNKAVTFVNNKTPAEITIREIDLDTCYKPDEIVIEVHAAALNPADIFIHNFCYSYLATKNLKTYSRDYSGVIVRVGPNVHRKWNVGDKVNGLFNHLYGDQGSLSQYLILSPEKSPEIVHMAPIPDSVIPWKQDYSDYVYNAAWPLVFGTAYRSLYDYNKNLDSTSKIIIIGASTSVANAAVQIAKNHMKIDTIVGVCSSSSISYNEQFGYDYLVPHDKGSIPDCVEKLQREKLNGAKFDLILDTVGNSEFLPVMNKFLKPRSEGSYYVTVVGDSKIDYSNPSMTHFIMGAGIFRPLNPWRKYNWALLHILYSEGYMELGHDMIAKKQYLPMIDSVYKFEEFQQAIDRVLTSKAKGKVVVTVK